MKLQDLIDKLTHELTKYDRRYNKRNPYAMGHYLEAVDKIKRKYSAEYFDSCSTHSQRMFAFNIMTQVFTWNGSKFDLAPLNKVVKDLDLLPPDKRGE